MKHSVSEAGPAAVFEHEQGGDLLQQMLERRVVAEPPSIDGVVVGELAGQTSEGELLVAFASLGLDARPARCAAVVDHSQLGLAVAVSFERGDPRKPIVLGVMQPQPRPRGVATGRPIDASVDGQKRVVIQADEEIELRCGESAIVLTADGRIHLRGQNITSEADMSQRILGASVSVN